MPNKRLFRTTSKIKLNTQQKCKKINNREFNVCIMNGYEIILFALIGRNKRILITKKVKASFTAKMNKSKYTFICKIIFDINFSNYM